MWRFWLEQLLGLQERVQIFSAFAVHRGGRSMLDVQLSAMRLLLASAIAWDYFVNLSHLAAALHLWLAVVWPCRNKRFLLTITVLQGDTHYPAEAMSLVGSYLWLHRGTNYVRITSTKFYDPTLQGGKGATYKGPRHLGWNWKCNFWVYRDGWQLQGSCLFMIGLQVQVDNFQWMLESCLRMTKKNLLWMRSRPQRACQTLTENAWPSWVQPKDVMTLSLLVTDPSRLNARASCSL